MIHKAINLMRFSIPSTTFKNFYLLDNVATHLETKNYEFLQCQFLLHSLIEVSSLRLRPHKNIHNILQRIANVAEL